MRPFRYWRATRHRRRGQHVQQATRCGTCTGEQYAQRHLATAQWTTQRRPMDRSHGSVAISNAVQCKRLRTTVPASHCSSVARTTACTNSVGSMQQTTEDADGVQCRSMAWNVWTTGYRTELLSVNGRLHVRADVHTCSRARLARTCTALAAHMHRSGGRTEGI